MKRRGFEWRVSIQTPEGDIFRFRGTNYEFDDGVDDLNTWDSEDGRFKTRSKGGRETSLTLTNATYDEDQDLYGSPRALVVDHDSPFTIALYPGDVNQTPHLFTNMLLMHVKGRGEKAGLQPETFEFKSSGSYNLANESAIENDPLDEDDG